MSFKFFLIIIIGLGLKGYSTTLSEKEIRKKIIQQAQNLLGYKGSGIQIKNKTFRFDCSGFVEACYYSAGLKLSKMILPQNRSKDLAFSLYKSTKKVRWNSINKKPRPGDLIFFNNTYDRNKNKRWDDLATHVGLVEKVFPDGRIHWIHLVRKGVVRYVTHLRFPGVYAKNGLKWNDYLRRRPKSDKKQKKISFREFVFFFCQSYFFAKKRKKSN